MYEEGNGLHNRLNRVEEFLRGTGVDLELHTIVGASIRSEEGSARVFGHLGEEWECLWVGSDLVDKRKPDVRTAEVL